VSFEVVTPLFCGGANPGEGPAELRVPSLKGALRFWHRAVAFGGPPREVFGRDARQFGSERRLEPKSPVIGQSPVLLDIVGQDTTPWRWDRRLIDRFTEGRGRQARNGIGYLAHMAVPARPAIAPGSRFTLRCCFPRGASEQQRRAILASLWLLGHFGGLGSRSRRGFGSLSLRSWEPEPGGEWPELGELPLWSALEDVSSWSDSMRAALGVLDRWFPVPDSGDSPPAHPHLGPELKLVRRSAASNRGPGAPAWARALDEAGRLLQDFRNRSEPDYSAVRAHLTGQHRLRQAPSRATFGLPLTFRYGSLPRGGNRVGFQAARKDGAGLETFDRHASLLFVRVARIADQHCPVFVRLDGPVSGQGGAGTRVILERGRDTLGRPGRVALDEFMDAIAAGSG